MSAVERNRSGADGISSRFEAVTAFLNETRQIADAFGVGEAALERIGQGLVALAARGTQPIPQRRTLVASWTLTMDTRSESGHFPRPGRRTPATS